MIKCVFALGVSEFPYNINDYFFIEKKIVNSNNVNYHQLIEKIWYLGGTPKDPWLYYVCSLQTLPTKEMSICINKWHFEIDDIEYDVSGNYTKYIITFQG